MKTTIYRIAAALVLLAASTSASAEPVFFWLKWFGVSSTSAAYVGGNQVR